MNFALDIQRCFAKACHFSPILGFLVAVADLILVGGRKHNVRQLSIRRLAQISLLLFLPVVASAAKAEPGNVLILFSNEAELPANQMFLRGVREALAQMPSQPPATNTEFLDLVRFPSGDHEAQLASLIKSKYQGIQFSVAIAAAPQALDFLTKYRDEIIPGVPIVFAEISRDDVLRRTLPPATTGVMSRWDIVRTLDMAIGLEPHARQIVFITGASNFDQLWEAEAREKLRAYEGRYQVSYWTRLPLADVIDRVGKLTRDTIILAPVFFEGGDGIRYIPRDSLSKIAAAAGAPVYATYDPLIGLGLVGGYMDTFDEAGREAARLAVRILKGERPESIAPFEGETHRYIVDWRALQRWGLDESALPPGTEIRFKQPTPWELYKFEITLVLVALLLQSLAILKLYIEGRRRRAAEREVRASKERMDLASSGVKLGLWDWDLRTGEIWATSSCRKMFGLGESEDLTRQSFAATVLQEDRPRVRSEIDAAIAERRSFETEYRIALPNEEPRWITTKGSPRSDEGQEVNRLVGVVLDVTERKKVEFEADQQRQQLAHLTRVSALGALSGAVAHELNQPLTAILTNAQAAARILTQEPVDKTEIRLILEDIMHDDKRAGDVIKHLRALLKKGESLMQTISVNELVTEVLALAHSDLILRDVAVSRQLDDELPVVHGDPIQLQQVLLNLIINACEAMSTRPTGDRLLFVRTTSNGNGHVRLSVSDTGEGLSPEASEKVFEPFYTTKALGLGLGLPICRSIITAHGGRLWAEAAPTRGAIFHVELPTQTGGHA